MARLRQVVRSPVHDPGVNEMRRAAETGLRDDAVDPGPDDIRRMKFGLGLIVVSFLLSIGLTILQSFSSG